MYGALRFGLASIVVAYHAGVTPFGLQQGASAVVVFYILSGYVITALLNTRFSQAGSFKAFLAERAVRIAPQYYLWLAVALLVTCALHWRPAPSGQPDKWTLFAYVTVLPVSLGPYLRYVDFPISSLGTSLSIECVFYLIAPFLIRGPRRSAVAAAACLIVFLLSATRAIPATTYTYYYAPAQFVFFLLGSFIYRREWRLLGITTGVLIAFLALGHKQFLSPEMLIGVLAGVPLVWSLRKLPSGFVDTQLGNVSYGCFLCQESVFYGLQHFGFIKGRPSYIVLALIISWALGYSAFWVVERPTIAFRRRLKNRLTRPVRADAVPASVPPG